MSRGSLAAKRGSAKQKKPEHPNWKLVVEAAAQACWLASAFAVERKAPRKAAYQSKQFGILCAIETGEMPRIRAAMKATLIMPESR